jgi:hypothetical protein
VRTLTPTEVDIVTVEGGPAIDAIGLVYVQWQVIRISDDDAPLWGVRTVVTRASGGMRVGGRGAVESRGWTWRKIWSAWIAAS